MALCIITAFFCEFSFVAAAFPEAEIASNHFSPMIDAAPSDMVIRSTTLPPFLSNEINSAGVVAGRAEALPQPVADAVNDAVAEFTDALEEGIQSTNEALSSKFSSEMLKLLEAMEGDPGSSAQSPGATNEGGANDSNSSLNPDFSLDLSQIFSVLEKNPKAATQNTPFPNISFDISYYRRTQHPGINWQDSESVWRLEISFGAESNSEVSVTASGEGRVIVEFDEEGKISYLEGGAEVRKKVAKYTHVIAVTVGPVPVWIQVNVKVFVGLNCSGGAQEGRRADFWIKPYLEAELEALLYSVIGGSGYAKPYIKAKYYGDERMWIVFAGAEVGLRGKVSAAGIVEVNFWNASWDVSTPVYAVQNDAGSGGDAPSNIGGAPMIGEGTNQGYLGPNSIFSNDSEDYFKIELGAGDTIQVKVFRGAKHSKDPDFHVSIHDRNGYQLEGGSANSVQCTVAEGDNYYVRVYRNAGWGLYKLSALIKPQDDLGSEQDAGNTSANALDVAPFLKPYAFYSDGKEERAGGEGLLSGGDRSDYYKIYLTQGHRIIAEMTPPSDANFNIRLLNPELNTVASSTQGGDAREIFDFTVGQEGLEGWYYVHVYMSGDYTGEEDYVLDIYRGQYDANKRGDAPSSPDNARQISPGTLTVPATYTGYLDASDGCDTYEISVFTDYIINVELISPRDICFSLAVAGPETTVYSDLGADNVKEISYTVRSSDPHYIQISRLDGRGIYTFVVWITQVNDAGSGSDAGDNSSGAILFSPGTRKGHMDAVDNKDYYRIAMNAYETICVRLTYPSEDNIELITDSFNNQYIIAKDDLKNAENSTWYFSAKVGSTDNYCLGLERKGGYGSGEYELSVSVYDQNDAGSGSDVGWLPGQGLDGKQVVVLPGRTYSGYLDHCDTEDLFRVYLGYGDTLDVEMTPPSGSNFDLYLYGPGKELFRESIDGGQGSMEWINYHVSAMNWVGFYYILVKRVSGSGSYDLDLSGSSSHDVWPKYQHDPQNTGRSLYIGPQENLLKWIYYAGMLGNYSSPAIGRDGTIYFGSGDGYLTALNPYGGTLKWRYPTYGGVRAGVAIGSDGAIYFGDGEGYFYALNPDGALKWRFDGAVEDFPIISPPVTWPTDSDDIIYFGTRNGVYALHDEGNTYTLKWSAYGSTSSYRPLAIGSDGTIYVGERYRLWAYEDLGTGDLGTGYSIKWEFWIWPYEVTSCVIDVDGTIYVADTNGTVYALHDEVTGYSLEWTEENVGHLLAIGEDKRIYVVSSRDGYLQALQDDGDDDPGGVEIEWSLDLGEWTKLPVIGADGTIYLYARDRLYAVRDEGDHAIVNWSLSTGSAGRLAIGSDGTIYSTMGFRLYAIGPDTMPPRFRVTWPAPGARLNNLTSIRGEAWDDSSGVENVEICIRRQSDDYYWMDTGWGASETWLPVSGTTSWSYSIPNSAWTSGVSYELLPRATDAVGNVGLPFTDGLTGGFTFDSTPPSLSILINENEFYTTSTSVQLSLTFSDVTGLEQYRLSNDGIFDTEEWIKYGISGESGSWTVDWTLENGTGLKTVYFAAMDRAGNVSSGAFDNIILVDVPSGAPELIDSPDIVNTGTPTFSWSDNGWENWLPSLYKLEINGVPKALTSAFTYTISPADALPNGIHTLRLWRVYPFGGPSVPSNLYTFTVSIPPPVLPVEQCTLPSLDALVELSGLAATHPSYVAEVAKMDRKSLAYSIQRMSLGPGLGITSNKYRCLLRELATSWKFRTSLFTLESAWEFKSKVEKLDIDPEINTNLIKKLDEALEGFKGSLKLTIGGDEKQANVKLEICEDRFNEFINYVKAQDEKRLPKWTKELMENEAKRIIKHVETAKVTAIEAAPEETIGVDLEVWPTSADCPADQATFLKARVKNTGMAPDSYILSHSLVGVDSGLLIRTVCTDNRGDPISSTPKLLPGESYDFGVKIWPLASAEGYSQVGRSDRVWVMATSIADGVTHDKQYITINITRPAEVKETYVSSTDTSAVMPA
jgi:outer membrane protein assembly factor BamB